MTTTEELQASTAKMGETLQTAAVARILHRSSEPLLKKTLIKAVEDSMLKWKTALWSDEAKIELFGHQT